jgi:lysophospholipase L1-like esterase
MGGYNSMPAWVANDPALAGPDHIHFTPKGARQVGEWLADAFDEELDKLMPR